MRQYRFDVPVDGAYSVQLRFAEIQATGIGQRVFTVVVEDEAVLVNLDVHRRVGARRALNFSFTARVTDGALNVRFFGQPATRRWSRRSPSLHRPDIE